MTMSACILVHDSLHIPEHQQRSLSADRLICLVHEEWLIGLRNRIVKDVSRTRSVSKDDAALFLAPSNQTLPKHWSRVCVKVIRKNDKLVPRLHNAPLYNTKPASSSMEHLVQCARENFRNLWATTHVQYSLPDSLYKLHNAPLYNTRPASSSMEHLVQCARENFRNLWATTHVQYSLQEMETFHTAEEQLTKVLQSYFNRLQPTYYIKLPDTTASNQTSPRHNTYIHDYHHHGNNIIPTLALIETDTTFFLVQPYVCNSVKDIVSYSPAILNTSHAKPLFILYQILQAILHLHHSGLTCGDLLMHNVRVDDKLWVQLSVPHVDSLIRPVENCTERDLNNSSQISSNDNSISDQINSNQMRMQTADKHDKRYERGISECENFVIEGTRIVQEFRNLDFRMEDLSRLTEDWVQHRISNFRYLMILNYLAGRRMDDPNHHPVLPWVMDFSSSNRGYRDLSMSKFRINKGDSQLDFTYEAMGDSSEHIPHHVSDVLSDITYYVYKARKTPKHILCTYVRTKWVPNEYPLSIERMYHWTPDECIPEFYTDPSLFTSIHEDLPDLELPTWCSSAAEFIERHMAVLESEQVSRKLHLWIDLTFGCKLSGLAAVRAKNVYLHLVDQHKTLTNHGVVQLFNQSHPKRVPTDQASTIMPPRMRKNEMLPGPSKELSSESPREVTHPETSIIKLPDDFDAVGLLDQFEALYSFSSKATDNLPPSASRNKDSSLKLSDINITLRSVWRDMQQFGCLMCELFLANRIQTQKPETTLYERYNLIGRLYSSDYTCLPRIIQNAAEYLLRLSTFKSRQSTEHCGRDDLLFDYPVIDDSGLPCPTPSLLLQPYSHILPFPDYFMDLYIVLNELKNVDKEIESERTDSSKSRLDKEKIEKVLSRKKVELIEKFLRSHMGKLTQEGHELILPYIIDLFSNPVTTVQAAWSLVGLVGKDIGPAMLKSNMLPYIMKLFNGEQTTPKHMKLYHRSFLVQLLLYLGLETFLTNFCTLLVEAVAGYKNFVVTMDTDESQDDLEDDIEENEFLTSQENLEGSNEHQGSELDPKEESEDIRPDQTDDYHHGDDDDHYDGTDDDILDEEFPNLSMDSVSKSESISTDQLSGRSLESLQEDEAGTADHGSAETTSIHSISHIIEMAGDKKLATLDTDSIDGELRDKTKHSVHFNTDRLSQSPASRDGNLLDQSRDVQLTDDQSVDFEERSSSQMTLDEKSSSQMIRSETDEFRQIHYSHTINICDVAAESIKWLSHRLGPLLTAKYLSKNLVRMLALCYLGEEQITVVHDEDEKLPKTTCLVQGDRNAQKILECLTYVSSLYGEQVILLQYIPCIVDLIHVAKRRTTVRAEAGLVAAVVLLRKIIPLLSDKTFLENLQDSILKDAVKPLLRLVISTSTSFPSGSSLRRLILYKMVDVIYILGLRLGFEMTRRYMTDVMQTFYKPFEQIYSSGEMVTITPVSSASDLQQLNAKDTSSMDEAYMNIKIDKDTNQYTIGSPITLNLHNQVTMEQGRRAKVVKSNYSLSEAFYIEDRDDMTDGRGKSGEILQSELRITFSPELALAAYIPLTSVFGSHHMEENLPSDDLIRKLCSQYDKALYSENKSIDIESPETPHTEQKDIGSNVAIVGNRICLQNGEDTETIPEAIPLRTHYNHKGILRMDPDETKCKDVYHNQHRHLKGNWLAYWEHELGLNERDTLFNFKQIKLHTFQGHSNSIRSITCLDNENSFISASKDKTVKLWSLASFGDGTGRCRYQWSYDNHKKSVFSVAYLENLRKVASSDSTVHIWDPFTGECVRQLDSSRHSPVIALSPLPSPSTVVVTATTDSTLRFLDVRKQNYAHEYKCVLGSAGETLLSSRATGIIRTISPSPDGSWVVVGFSTGIVSVLDLNTGMLLGSWKAHEGEILQLKAYNKSSFLSTSFDMSMKLWNVEGKEICSFKGHTEPVHCVNFYKSQIVSATTSNKIGVHTSVDSQANFSATKLRSEVFKGVLTSMSILPLNRTLLLGADNGLIRLLC